MPEKKTKLRLSLKNLAMLLSYFDYIFVHLRQKARLRPELNPKFLWTLGPNPAQTRTRPKNPGPIYNSGSMGQNLFQERPKIAAFFYNTSMLGHKCSQDFWLGGGRKSPATTLPEIFERKTFCWTKIL